MDYKVTYYQDTCSAWIDPNPTIKYFEFFEDMEDWINEEVEKRVNQTIENSFDPVSDVERVGMEEWERCHIKIEENGQIIKDKFI